MNRLLIVFPTVLFIAWFITSCEDREYTNPHDPETLASYWAPSDIIAQQFTEGGKTVINKVELSWTDNATGEDGYVIDRKINTSWEESVGTVGEDITTWVDSSFYLDKLNAYRVYSIASGNKSTFSPIVSLTPKVPTPKNISGEHLELGVIKLSWYDQSIGEDGVKIDRRIELGEWDLEYAKVGKDVQEWIDSSAIPISKNIYRLYTYFGDHNSNWIDLSMEPVMIEPTITSWEKISENQLQIAWTDYIEGEDGYIIDKRIDNGEWIEEYAILDENTSKWIDEDFSVLNDYSYRLYSYFKEFQSSSSEVHIITGCDDIIAINYEVDANLNDESCRYGINVPEDHLTIQAAIDASIDGDTILVSKGSYLENINYYGKRVRVMSRYLNTNDRSFITGTIIDGSNSGHVITFENDEHYDAELNGFTIKNGNHSEGGGIKILGSIPTLRNLIIEENEAEERGGGIYYDNDTIYDIFILNNVIIRNNKTPGAHADGKGGGIYFGENNSSIVMKNVLIHGNTSAYGGGIYFRRDGGSFSTLLLENVTIADNLNIVSGPHSTNRKGDTEGTGLDLRLDGGADSFTSTVNIINTIFFNNCSNWNDGGTEGNCGSQIQSDSYDPDEVIIQYTNQYPVYSSSWRVGSNISLDPLFNNLGNYRFQIGSPSIDAGDPDSQYNDADGSRNDMGAYGGPGGDWNK